MVLLQQQQESWIGAPYLRPLPGQGQCQTFWCLRKARGCQDLFGRLLWGTQHAFRTHTQQPLFCSTPELPASLRRHSPPYCSLICSPTSLLAHLTSPVVAGNGRWQWQREPLSPPATPLACQSPPPATHQFAAHPPPCPPGSPTNGGGSSKLRRE